MDSKQMAYEFGKLVKKRRGYMAILVATNDEKTIEKIWIAMDGTNASYSKLWRGLLDSGVTIANDEIQWGDLGKFYLMGLDTE